MNLPIDQQLKRQITQLTQAKQYDKARQVAQKLVQLNPRDIEAWFALAQLEEALGAYEQAVLALYKVCQVKSPVYAHAVEKTVDLCLRHGLPHMGVDPAKALIKLKPESAVAHNALGQFWYQLGQNITAMPFFKKAIELDPKVKDYYVTLSLCQFYVGECMESVATLKKMMGALGEQKLAYNLLVPAFNYPSDLDEELVVSAHMEAGSYFSEAFRSDFDSGTSLSPINNRKIRVAYLSSDLKNHPVATFFKAIVEAHDRDCYEVTCYFDGDQEDEVSEQIKAAADKWVSTFDLTDEQLCDRIRNDGVDILVDLATYVAKTRLSVIAKRAAPVQVNYLGYPNTSGLNEMDFRVTDYWADPESMTNSQYSEKLKRLEGGFLCYTPPEDAPDVADLPLDLSDEGICFGSFNSFTKLTPQMLNLWARILNQVEGSALLIKAKPLGEEALKERVWDLFKQGGISKERIKLYAWAEDVSSHLEFYKHVDIHLDSFPYNGTTTTVESLRQGVPVVTLKGNNHRSRVGCSLLTQVGLTDLIADNEQEYIDIATNLAGDVERLRTLRKTLRDKVDHSSLCDRERFIRELESAYSEMVKEKIKH